MTGRPSTASSGSQPGGGLAGVGSRPSPTRPSVGITIARPPANKLKPAQAAHHPGFSQVLSVGLGDPVPGTLFAIGHLSSGLAPWLVAPVLLGLGLILIFSATRRSQGGGRSRHS